MTITVKTMSGTFYTFTQKDGRTFFQKGLISGEVVRINPITIGKGINMDFYKERLYGGLEDSTMFINSTPVTEITVIL